jgi:fatty-acid desaturase
VSAVSPPLPRPDAVDGKLFSSNVSVFVVIHAVALLALIPYLFSWTGVALVFIGNYVYGGLGINIGYHRLLTHHGFRCPKWLEHTFAVLGVCCLQDSPSRWVAIHRLHHQHTDKQADPHSPLVSFSWSWMGWLVFKNRHLRKRNTLKKYTKDLMQDPFYERLHRHRFWLYIYAAHAALYLIVGYLAGWMMTGTAAGALQFGLSMLVWGVAVRTVYVWHVTWTANAMAHTWGYRNYETGENSRNNWLVSLLSNGEGWHNNHHAYPRCARHGQRWWEVDMIYGTIVLLRMVGLATDVVTPDQYEKPRPVAERVPGPLARDFDPDHDDPKHGHAGRIDPAHAQRVPPPHGVDHDPQHASAEAATSKERV